MRRMPEEKLLYNSALQLDILETPTYPAENANLYFSLMYMLIYFPFSFNWYNA